MPDRHAVLLMLFRRRAPPFFDDDALRVRFSPPLSACHAMKPLARQDVDV